MLFIYKQSKTITRRTIALNTKNTASGTVCTDNRAEPIRSILLAKATSGSDYTTIGMHRKGDRTELKYHRLNPNDDRLCHNGDRLRHNDDRLGHNDHRLAPNGDMLVPNGDRLRLNVDRPDHNGHTLCHNGHRLVPNGDRLCLNCNGLCSEG